MRRLGQNMAASGAVPLPPLGRGDAGSSSQTSASSSTYEASSMHSESSANEKEELRGNAMEYELTNAKLKQLEAVFQEVTVWIATWPEKVSQTAKTLACVTRASI